jgi:hypothetical protein
VIQFVYLAGLPGLTQIEKHSSKENKMSTIDPELEKQLQQGFKHFNRGMLALWRLGLGPWLSAWPEVGGQILVISHTGRVSGLKRRTPLNYAIVDGEVYIAAGFGSRSDWYRNLKVNPSLEVWLPQWVVVRLCRRNHRSLTAP